MNVARKTCLRTVEQGEHCPLPRLKDEVLKEKFKTWLFRPHFVRPPYIYSTPRSKETTEAVGRRSYQSTISPKQNFEDFISLNEVKRKECPRGPNIQNLYRTSFQ
eukprot:TRINITY_DN22115_c0_g2_i1.p1 TRINITY_DN22115_c0_g2~~TRINITY_DN22115_c0_g2_i1.p1  ORF type:complete len:105 (+),score=4.02 TRINITY_DN22115_c0_g2_i1:152-466(+)